MGKISKYESKPFGSDGKVQYSAEEENTWRFLVQRQNRAIQGRACKEFLDGVTKLNFNERIPQHYEITEILNSCTGWGVEPVPAIIPAEQFFTLLSKKRFPSANFIRIPEEIDYLQEPDIFHEIYGHCPLLTNQNYADYMQEYGRLALTVSGKERMRLFRLFWFTIEFGLLKEANELKIYGGGILSSYKETLYALEDTAEKISLIDPLIALRTPYRIDILQPVYFVVNGLDHLFDIVKKDLVGLAKQSLTLPDFPPKFAPKEKDPQASTKDSTYE
jgi:phenylalanine-4-hydroxylase